jgi:hypothetical protein
MPTLEELLKLLRMRQQQGGMGNFMGGNQFRGSRPTQSLGMPQIGMPNQGMTRPQMPSMPMMPQMPTQAWGGLNQQNRSPFSQGMNPFANRRGY